MITSEQPPVIYQYSVKLETTLKAVNVTVHVHSDNPVHAQTQAIELLMKTRTELEQKGLKAAPLLEVNDRV